MVQPGSRYGQIPNLRNAFSDPVASGCRVTKEDPVSADSLPERLVDYLTDMHSTEENALSRLRAGLLERIADHDLGQMGLAA